MAAEEQEAQGLDTHPSTAEEQDTLGKENQKQNQKTFE